MRVFSRIVAAAIAAAVTVQPALAQSRPCISSEQIHAGLRVVLPMLIDSTATTCKPMLPDDSYLAAHGAAFAQRFAAREGDDALVTALLPYIDKQGKMEGLGLTAIKTVIVDRIEAGMAKDFSPKTCKAIDKSLALLDPLPADNALGLIELIVRQMDADNASKAARRAGSKAGDQSAPGGAICPSE